MSLEALGNLGDFVSGIAVVVTLVYLATQIRQNTRQVKQSVKLARAQTIKGANNVGQSLLAIAQDSELARIFRTGLDEYSSLSGDERLRFTMLLGAIVSAIAAHVTEQISLGYIGDQRFGDQAVSLKQFLLTPGGREWWKRNASQYQPVFQNFVNAEVLSLPDEPPAAFHEDGPAKPSSS
jgi:hypothetical protein